MKKIKILIVDDHDLIHNGIKDILKTVKRYKIIGNAYNGEEAIDKSLELKPDIILMDISMPVMNGIEATRFILDKLPEVKILALTQHEENEYVLQFLKSGGSGYLLKNSKKDEFINAIDSIMENKRVLSHKISEQLLNDLMNKSNPESTEVKAEVPLTKREIEIIKKIADDMTNQQMADELHISLRTVETHRRNLMQKLNVNTVVALLKYATHHHIISFEE
jgi:two-component system nitrate/nitrite response regulator NarL